MPCRNLVVIGVSTGGPLTLREIFLRLTPLNAAILVVLHIAPPMDARIAKGLDAVSAMPVALAQHGEYLASGQVYLAPGGFHLRLDPQYRVELVRGERVNYVQPSVDVTMSSLHRQLHGILVGAVLTGMGKDGAEGIRHVKRVGGITIAQDQKTSTIYGMPKAAAQTGAVDFVLSPAQIADKLTQLIPPLA
ncbi:CheB methylesterase domain-containing protein [Geomonas sp. Red32]|uniref:CheB methylesterase domain-containing protein n=1 Tax=Geomonas sp. Red32 TaxID=2912856 RepID=UPI00202CC60B|nr:CheB methylesterase domain-containing protein [Geomonas sp. Red32]MCM0082899.1 CheB methylesterase domain-containing protein [Geomonas sp. Red32]